MTVPVYKGTGTVFGTPGGAATTAAIAAPASIAVDDILYLIALTNSTTTLSGLPSGWAHVTGSPVTSTGGSGNATLNVCWKRAVAGDVGAVSYTFTLSASDYCEGAISNASGVNNSGSPWDTSTGAPVFAKTSAATTTAPAVSLTTQGADRLIVNGAINQTGGTPWTASSGYTKDFDHTGGGTFSTCTGYHVGQATAGSTGSVQPVCPASGEMVNFLGALIPAGSSTVNGTASIAGAGALTATVVESVTAALTGAGVVTAAGSSSGGASASLAGAGSLTAKATQLAGSSPAGAGTVTALATQNGKASIAGAGVLAAAGVIAGSATLTGSGAVSSAVRQLAGASLAGAGSLSAGAGGLVTGSASLVGVGVLAINLNPCTTPRPFTGTTMYATATTARPNTGVTVDPC